MRAVRDPLVVALRAMLKGGTWDDREALAVTLQTRARACLRRFGYLHPGNSDFRDDIPTDAVLSLLKVEEGPEGLILPVLIRELGRFLDLRPFPAVRMPRALRQSAPGATGDRVRLLLAQDDERLLLALDDLLRHRVRQEQHHWWCRQNPRHSRWLRSLKRVHNGRPGLVRGKIGWHWALYFEAPGLPAERVEADEIRRALRDRDCRKTPAKVLDVVQAILAGGGRRYVLLGEVISVIVDLETADYCSMLADSRGPGGQVADCETDRMIQSIRGARLRESLYRRCLDLVEDDRIRDIRRGRPPQSPEIARILVQAVVDDLVPGHAAAGSAASFRGRLSAMLAGHVADGQFQALYERARYMRCRLAKAGEELMG